MIMSKMEISTVIQSLNELEKLKLLLFDEDQYYLFEHIPKPFLIDPNGIKGSDTVVNYEEHFDKKSSAVCKNCQRMIKEHSSSLVEWEKVYPSRQKAVEEYKKELLLSRMSVSVFSETLLTQRSKLQILSPAKGSLRS